MSGNVEYVERAITSERRGHTKESLEARLTALYKKDGVKDPAKSVADGLKLLASSTLELPLASFSRACNDWADLRGIQMALPNGAWGKLPVPGAVNG